MWKALWSQENQSFLSLRINKHHSINQFIDNWDQFSHKPKKFDPLFPIYEDQNTLFA